MTKIAKYFDVMKAVMTWVFALYSVKWYIRTITPRHDKSVTEFMTGPWVMTYQ